MILYECICVGRTVPEDSKKYGRKVCSIFYSPELRKLIRVYPLMIDNPCKARTVSSLSLTVNSNDSREESFKLTDPVFGILETSIKKDVSHVRNILESCLIGSIKSLNEQKKSIGVIKTLAAGSIKKIYSHDSDPDQMLLFNDLKDSMGFDTKVIPYLFFKDERGSHNLQIREWGTWEYIRKNPDSPNKVFSALKLESEQYLIVGNMLQRRSNWLVVKTFEVKDKAATLF
jgi:hypothetical protein